MHVLSLSTVGSKRSAATLSRSVLVIRNFLPTPSNEEVSYVQEAPPGSLRSRVFSRLILIVRERVNHGEGSERGKLGVKRRNPVLAGAKLLKIRVGKSWRDLDQGRSGVIAREDLGCTITVIAYAARIARSG
jgi:hypothetical protein